MNIKKKAAEFIKKYQLRKSTLTADTMKDILKKQGFMLVRYNNRGTSDDTVQQLLETINLFEYSRGKNGFTYITSTDKIVFLHQRMSTENELYILLHEEGHIFCEHPVRQGVAAYSDILLEQEANAFAFYVMEQLKRKPIQKTALVCCALALVLGFAFYTDAQPKDLPQPAKTVSSVAEKKVYVTKTGTVYHSSWCHYIEGKTNLRETSIQSAIELGLPPCSSCRPDLH